MQLLRRAHREHWLGVRAAGRERFAHKMRRFRARLNALLQAPAPEVTAPDTVPVSAANTAAASPVPAVPISAAS